MKKKQFIDKKEILKLDKYFKKINKGIGLDNASGSKTIYDAFKIYQHIGNINKKNYHLINFDI